MNKNKFLDVLGALFAFVGFTAVVNALTLGNHSQIIWLCYIGTISLGIGILSRKDYMITAQLNILAIPLIFWCIDFIYMLITGNALWNITSYFFEKRFDFSSFISLQHLFTIPLALVCLYFIKLKRNDAWKFSLIQIILIFVASFTFESNVNCVREACFNFGFQVSGYAYYALWFAGMFTMIFITNFILVKAFRN